MTTTVAGWRPGARDAVLRDVIWPARFLTLALTLLFVFGLSIPDWLQFLPLLASLVLFGLPHGAVDHLVVVHLARWRAGRSGIGAIVAVYLGLAGLYLVLWAVTPTAAFVFFIALTWYHWGQGDLFTLLAVERADFLQTSPQRGLTLIVRGGLPMLVPLLAAPDVYRAVADASIGVFQPDGAEQISWVFDEPARLAIGIAFATLVFGTLAMTWPRRDPNLRRHWAANAADTILLALYFLIVPPLLAIGVYFCCWHATRHIVRVMQLDRDADASPGVRWLNGAATIRFAREAALPTIGALAFLAVLYLAVPRPPGDPIELTGIYLVGLAALTFPHTLVVTWMDWRQGIWRPSNDDPSELV